MAISENKTRVQVTLANDLVKRLDAACELMGLTRSQYIAFTVGNSLATSKVMQDGLTESVKEVLAQAAVQVQG